jgi:hypothetical protein
VSGIPACGPPDGAATFMLPASAKDSSGVKELDALLREAQQQQVFGFQDGPEGTVWNASPPKALKLDTPEVEKAFTNWLKGVSELFAEVDRTMSQSDEPYFHQYRKELAPHFATMAELKSQVKPLMTQLSAADVDHWQIRVKDLLAAACRLDTHAVVAVAQCKLGGIAPGRSGRRVTQWSRKSRTAMCRTFAELDYTPLVDDGRVPAMITLTYPGDWESVAPDGASVKRHMVLWRKRFHREYGEPARYIWKLEFQLRGAPHVHLWMAPPTRRGRSGQPFRDWLSHAWTNIVAHPHPSERARHLLAGTAVDVLNGLRACDPKRLAIYFTKHSSPNTLGEGIPAHRS